MMITRPKVCAPELIVADARSRFADDHVHALLLVDSRRRLLAVVERADLPHLRSHRAARLAGRLEGRVADAQADLHTMWQLMWAEKRRRLAVIDPGDRTLVGLLCLKRNGRGFCTNKDVDARVRGAAFRTGTVTGAHPTLCCAEPPRRDPPRSLQPTRRRSTPGHGERVD